MILVFLFFTGYLKYIYFFLKINLLIIINIIKKIKIYKIY